MKRNYIFILSGLLLLLMACHDKKQNTILEQFFEDNILDQTFIITEANDGNTDLTSNYLGYNFVLKKGSDYHNGPLIVKNGSLTYAGTWSCDEDYGRLKIVLPSLPSAFTFLTRDWRFTSKALPELKFSPWGGSGSIKLTMKRQ